MASMVLHGLLNYSSTKQLSSASDSIKNSHLTKNLVLSVLLWISFWHITNSHCNPSMLDSYHRSGKKTVTQLWLHRLISFMAQPPPYVSVWYSRLGPWYSSYHRPLVFSCYPLWTPYSKLPFLYNWTIPTPWTSQYFLASTSFTLWSAKVVPFFLFSCSVSSILFKPELFLLSET